MRRIHSTALTFAMPFAAVGLVLLAVRISAPPAPSDPLGRHVAACPVCSDPAAPVGACPEFVRLFPRAPRRPGPASIEPDEPTPTPVAGGPRPSKPPRALQGVRARPVE